MQKAILARFGETCLFKTFHWGKRLCCKKSEYANFFQNIVKKNWSSLQKFQVDEVGLDEFFMR